jgi:DcaP outer membrane protein
VQTPPPPAPEPSWAPPLPAEEPPPEASAAPPAGSAAAAAAGTEERPPDDEPETKEEEEEDSTTLELYGYVMTDTGISFGDISDPAWFDTLRPTKLPTTEDEFGKGPRTFFGVRQTRFGVKSDTPTDWGDLTTQFEFELFGVGVDEGQTTFRLRHAYGEIGWFGAGQTWSPFMDIDVFPNSVEYWGPNAMVFFRNVQLRFMPVKGETSWVTFALERPGADADLGEYEEQVELAGVMPRFVVPDVSAEGRYGGDWGYLELAGIVRVLAWDETMGDDDLSDEVVGYGLNLTSNIHFLTDSKLKLAVVYGRGIQNYMNDAGSDVGVEIDDSEPGGVRGVALPLVSALAFVDLAWSELMTSSLGWGGVFIDNSDGQAPEAFHVGHYALVNLLFTPIDHLLLGPELQYARRENNEDGFNANEFRVQFSAKFDYSKTIGVK